MLIGKTLTWFLILSIYLNSWSFANVYFSSLLCCQRFSNIGLVPDSEYLAQKIFQWGVGFWRLICLLTEPTHILLTIVQSWNWCIMLAIQNFFYYISGMWISIWMVILTSCHHSKWTCQNLISYPHPAKPQNPWKDVKKNLPVEIVNENKITLISLLILMSQWTYLSRHLWTS